MADVINLRRARKQKARDAREKTAADNRRKHGMTDAEKKRLEAERALSERRLADHRIDRDDG